MTHVLRRLWADEPMLSGPTCTRWIEGVAAWLDRWDVPPPEESGPAATVDPTFSIRRLPDGTWRAYLHSVPPWTLGLRSRVLHLLGDEVGPYVCWSRPLPTRANAVAVARLWTRALRRLCGGSE